MALQIDTHMCKKIQDVYQAKIIKDIMGRLLVKKKAQSRVGGNWKEIF